MQVAKYHVLHMLHECHLQSLAAMLPPFLKACTFSNVQIDNLLRYITDQKPAKRKACFSRNIFYLFMAQSLSYTWSDVRLQPLHRSLSRTAVPRQIISFSAVKALHGPTPPLTTAHCAGVEQGPVLTNQGDTK